MPTRRFCRCVARPCSGCGRRYDHVTVEVIDGANHGYERRDVESFEVIRHWLMAL